MGEVIVVPEPVSSGWYGSAGSGPEAVTFRARTETLKQVTVCRAIDRRLLEQHGYQVTDLVLHELREELLRRVEEAGRLVVGDVLQIESDDAERDCVWVRLTAKTRESDRGEWPSIYEAARTDGWWP